MTQDDMNEHASTSQRGAQFVDSHLHRSARQEQTIADWGQEVTDKKRQESETTRDARLGDAKGKERATETDDFDDFDDFDENIFTMDQAFLESLDRVEFEAMKGVGASKEPAPTLPPPVF
jgi:hypothetical protein